MIVNRTVLLTEVYWDTNCDMETPEDRLKANSLPTTVRMDSADFFRGQIAQDQDPANLPGGLEDMFLEMAMDHVSQLYGYCLEGCVISVR